MDISICIYIYIYTTARLTAPYFLSEGACDKVRRRRPGHHANLRQASEANTKRYIYIYIYIYVYTVYRASGSRCAGLSIRGCVRKSVARTSRVVHAIKMQGPWAMPVFPASLESQWMIPRGNPSWTLCSIGLMLGNGVTAEVVNVQRVVRVTQMRPEGILWRGLGL